VFDVGILQVRHPDGQVFAFEPGSLSMAFAITGAPIDEARFETLRNPTDLSQWAAAIMGAREVVASAADLAHAKLVRSAIWSATEAVIEGRLPDAEDRRVLNDAARRAPPRPKLAPDGGASWARPVDADAVLSAVAGDAIELVGGPRATRLKRCQGVNCSIPFVDTSRPGTRRWCSMERCGNRAKVRTHYHQQRQEASR
jgi:predicted RNA-binding Zn ribbon-like protein